MTAGRDWTLVTVTHNSVDDLRASWLGARLGEAQWVVVDNASRDGSATVAESLGARVVRLTDNRGFSSANNVGLRLVTTKWVMFVNPDLRVAGAEDLDRLAQVSHANGGSLIAPQLLNGDGSRQPNGRGLPFLLDKVANRSVHLPGSRLREYTRTDLATPTYVAWAMGAAIGGPTKTIRALGGWDDRYFIYYEDHDLGLRGWSAGVPTVVEPAVQWTHGWKRSTRRPRLVPWKHELRSMRTFYTTYPELVRRGRPGQASRWADMEHSLWEPARARAAAGMDRETKSALQGTIGQSDLDEQQHDESRHPARGDSESHAHGPLR